MMKEDTPYKQWQEIYVAIIISKKYFTAKILLDI